MLLIAGLGAGGLLLFALCTNAAAQYTYLQTGQATVSSLQFPLHVGETFLEAVELAAYEGPFWEDGTAQEVTDVAALVVKNTGGCYVEQGAVVLDWGEDRMVFELSWLPPGEKVLVLEKSRKPYQTITDFQCYGWERECYPENMGAVTVRAVGEVSLGFTNRTDSTLSAVAMYKHYDGESAMYIGGITYSISPGELLAGETSVVIPWRYADGYSRVVCVMTDLCDVK